MCGIVGFCNAEIEVREVAHRMNEQIIRRGPDGEGIWAEHDNSVTLGHRRLAILDLSENGSQPMLSRSERYVIAYNGEIYNHLEIRKRLEQQYGCVFKGTSDTETLVECFEHMGIKSTLACIKGMFAIAVFDRQNKKLFLIRDRVGEKPLYYGFIHGKLYFASDLQCFKAIPDCQLEMDASVVELYLRRGYIPAPFSIYRGIYKCTPGTYICLDYPYTEDTIKSESYWSYQNIAKKQQENSFKGTIEEASRELERLLKQAIKGQMLSDVPLGAFLSAGIDSSTIVALMQEVSDKPVHTFTIGVEDEQLNEALIAKEIANILGTNHTEQYVTTDDMKKIIPNLASIYTEPFADSSQIPTFAISQLARQKVTVALSGDGGDELFCGYGRYTEWIPNEWEKINRFPKWIKQSRRKMYDIMSDMGFAEYEARAKKYSANSQEQLYACISAQDTSYVMKGSRYLDTYEQYSPGLLRDVSSNFMMMDFGMYLPDDILAKVDRAAMYHSLETRIPFLDRDIIEFVWTLPIDMKYNDGVTKCVLRKVLYKYVPRQVLERPKTGFSVPLDVWLKDGELREWAEDLMSDSSLESVGLFNTKMLRKMWRMYCDKGVWNESIWYILMFMEWWKKQYHIA